jgi:hypothetical protein
VKWTFIIIGVLVWLFCGLIASRIKKGLISRKYGVSVGISGFAGMGLLLIGLIMNMFPSHHPQIVASSANVNNRTVISQNTSSNTDSTERNSENSTQNKAEVNNPENSTNASSTTGSNIVKTDDPNQYIPGLNLEDVRLGLQNTWGLRFKMSQGANGTTIYEGTSVDPDTGVTLKCDIYFDSVTEVKEIECVVDGASVMGTDSPSDIDLVASGFLGYCATAPYSQATPQNAKQWTMNHVAGNTGESETNFGKVQFRLMHTTWIKSLLLSNAKS